MPKGRRSFTKMAARAATVLKRKGYSQDYIDSVVNKILSNNRRVPGTPSSLLQNGSHLGLPAANKDVARILALPAHESTALAVRATKSEVAIVDKFVNEAASRKLTKSAIKAKLEQLYAHGALSKKGIARAMAALVGGGILTYGVYELSKGDGPSPSSSDDDLPIIAEGELDRELKTQRILDEIFGSQGAGRIYDKSSKAIERLFDIPLEDISYTVDSTDSQWAHQYARLTDSEIMALILKCATRLKSLLFGLKDRSEDVYYPIAQDVSAFLSNTSDTLLFDSPILLDQISLKSGAVNRASATNFYKKVRAMQVQANTTVVTEAVRSIASFATSEASFKDDEGETIIDYDAIPGDIKAAVHVVSQADADTIKYAMSTMINEEDHTDEQLDALQTVIVHVLDVVSDNDTLLGRLVKFLMGKISSATIG